MYSCIFFDTLAVNPPNKLEINTSRVCRCTFLRDPSSYLRSRFSPPRLRQRWRPSCPCISLFLSLSNRHACRSNPGSDDRTVLHLAFISSRLTSRHVSSSYGEWKPTALHVAARSGTYVCRAQAGLLPFPRWNHRFIRDQPELGFFFFFSGSLQFLLGFVNESRNFLLQDEKQASSATDFHFQAEKVILHLN